ncbi:uncharacterized protein C8A04DRAFT_11421 [Dichotomopilus funicola]|uniref:Uncharacterized protein n=1 Tax=Dichotomopilus funicola TaxID=1934379 RepID=A0AAN6ZPI4_9PEZI|nr:hypothetical protein C8A04DRAFT_11421 [Dichotomopilus funicola]
MDLGIRNNLVAPKEPVQGHHWLPETDGQSSIITPDLYARQNELTIDSLQFDWDLLSRLDAGIDSTLVELEPGQLVKTAELRECLFRAIIPTAEKWQLPAASLQLLQQVCKISKREDLMMECISRQHFLKTQQPWKLEVPALRSDHDADCRQYRRQVEAFRRCRLRDHGLPLHPADTERGEGLEFPASLIQRDKERVDGIGAEGLRVTKVTLLYLQETLTLNWEDDIRQDFLKEPPIYQDIGATEHLTPPLSPLIAALPDPFTPDLEVCQVPELSDSESRLSEDIKKAEGKIFESEIEFWEGVIATDTTPAGDDDIDISTVIKWGDFNSPASPTSPTPVSRDLKVDVPLLPWSDNNDGLPRSGAFVSNELAAAKELVVSSDTMSGSDGPTGQLVTLFQEGATKVMRSAEQEKLQPLYAKARVSVPVLDFSVPIPEWEQGIWETSEMFRYIQDNTDVDWRGPKWPHNRNVEQRMIWTPVAHMKDKTLTVEKIEVHADDLELFLERDRNDEVLTSVDYIHKESGLANFRIPNAEQDGVDCLEPLGLVERKALEVPQDRSKKEGVPLVQQPTRDLDEGLSAVARTTVRDPEDLTLLVSKRKRLIDEAADRKLSNNERKCGLATPLSISATDMVDTALVPSTNVLRGFMNEYTDFGPLVDNFCDMNFPKKPKLTHSPFFGPPEIAPASSKAKEEEAARLMPPPPKPVPALAPPINPPQSVHRAIVSSTVSQPFIQHVKAFLPAVELIPRIYEKHRPPGWTPGMPSPNLDEADFVVTPSTGILLTTMVQLRQKAPPSAGVYSTATSTNAAMAAKPHNLPGFYRIIENVAARHERLLVLVSESNKHSETASPLSQSDARSLTEFQGLVAGIPGIVQLVYVGGGVETLAKWVAAVVCEYHASEGEEVARKVSEMLLPVETSWEVFLRRAGMNACAAQVVLGTLKVPAGIPAVGCGDGGVFGLPRFVMMSREERVELFAQMLGGRKVLDRVSDVLDGPWEN